MKNKTCGDCRYLVTSKDYGACCIVICDAMYDDDRACYNFAPPTNGDKIRQGGDYALAQFRGAHRCDVCAYAAPIDASPACLRPDGESCFDGMLAWLNAPAESEGEK